MHVLQATVLTPGLQIVRIMLHTLPKGYGAKVQNHLKCRCAVRELRLFTDASPPYPKPRTSKTVNG